MSNAMASSSPWWCSSCQTYHYGPCTPQIRYVPSMPMPGTLGYVDYGAKLDKIIELLEKLVSREVSAPKFCKACGAEPGDECKTASTLEVPADCINP
jgi:hypothetical protein